MYEEIKYAVNGPVATIHMNRPDYLNALTSSMLVEIRHALARAERSEEVTGVVLTGEGRGFSAGMDMNALNQSAQSGANPTRGDKEEHLRADPGDPGMGPDFQVTYAYLLSLQKPLIAAINGPCAGLAFAIAMLCDMRYAAEDAVFTTAFSQRGLIAEHGLSWILPRVVGPGRALDLLWSARRIDGLEAEKMGLVNRAMPREEVVPAAQAYIRTLADTVAPISLKIIKQQIYRHLNMNLGEAMTETNRLMAESLQRADFKEGVVSFVEKRPPRFTPLQID